MKTHLELLRDKSLPELHDLLFRLALPMPEKLRRKEPFVQAIAAGIAERPEIVRIAIGCDPMEALSGTLSALRRRDRGPCRIPARLVRTDLSLMDALNTLQLFGLALRDRTAAWYVLPEARPVCRLGAGDLDLLAYQDRKRHV